MLAIEGSRTRTEAWALLACAGWFVNSVSTPAFATELADSQRLSRATPEAPAPSIRPPRSTHDLLLNLRSALESDLLLRDAFYTDANLTRFFAPGEVQWIRNDARKKHVVLRGVTYIPTLGNRKTQIGILSSLGESPQRTEQETVPRASISIGCACALRAENLDAAFANANRTVKSKRRPTNNHYPRPPRASDPMGNKLAVYEIPTQPGLASSLHAEFDPAGNITSIEAIQRKQP
jgi:hypothetical protein